VARLHAKVGLIDDRLLLVGSMNIDPRSAHTNTELAVAIDSAELVRMVQNHFQPTVSRVANEVRLAADGQGLVWVTVDAQGVEHLNPEPSPPAWRLWGLWLMSMFVSDDLL
jgi:phosphatidylserine/phosphatidylglycerophosphate/cardiolipin synthase-like enzyme